MRPDGRGPSGRVATAARRVRGGDGMTTGRRGTHGAQGEEGGEGRGCHGRGWSRGDDARKGVASRQNTAGVPLQVPRRGGAPGGGAPRGWQGGARPSGHSWLANTTTSAAVSICPAAHITSAGKVGGRRAIYPVRQRAAQKRHTNKNMHKHEKLVARVWSDLFFLAASPLVSIRPCLASALSLRVVVANYSEPVL